MTELISTSLDQTVDLGRRLGQLATPGDVFALDGELGAGKTQLVRGLALGLGLDPAQVSSPTFVIMHEYLPPAPGSQGDHAAGRGSEDAVLVHIDAYRITGPDDLATVGFDDELRAEAVTAVEWAARIADLPGVGTEALGEHRLHILIEHRGDESRRLFLTPYGRWRDRLAALTPPADFDAMNDRKLHNKQSSAPCPTCKTPVAAGTPTFPFCSDRCKTIDLGRWLDEKYKVSRPIEQSDIEEED